MRAARRIYTGCSVAVTLVPWEDAWRFDSDILYHFLLKVDAIMNIYLVCAPSGFGKTTWIQSQMTENDKLVSYDEITGQIERANQHLNKTESELRKLRTTNFITSIKDIITNKEYESLFIDCSFNYLEYNEIFSKIFPENNKDNNLFLVDFDLSFSNFIQRPFRKN